MKHILLHMLTLLAGYSVLHAAPLDDTFANPPDESKPWCYWYWLNNNISNGKRRVYAEAYTSKLNLAGHPALIKQRGEELFCEGINHFVLHVYAHQTSDGAPGKNPWFGTPFHRNTPWFVESRD